MIDYKVNLVMKQKRDAKRRGDVFTESVQFEGQSDHTVVPKDDAARILIEASVAHNFLFASISQENLKVMVDVMESKPVKTEDTIITEGDMGDFFYVVERGTFEITVNGVNVGVVGPGGSFGELALLYDSPRAATIKASSPGQLWALDRNTFRRIIACNTSQQYAGCKSTLQRVPLLESLTEDQLDKLAEAIQEVTFDQDEKIITKGEPGNVFYIVKSGDVLCTDTGDALEDLLLGEGDYFGERALMTNEPRAANVIAKTRVTAMALDRQSFDDLLGPLKELIDRNMGIRVLKSVPILTKLSTTERERLFEAFSTLKFEAGENIITEGENGSTFYIVKSGTLSVFKKKGECNKSRAQFD